MDGMRDCQFHTCERHWTLASTQPLGPNTAHGFQTQLMRCKFMEKKRPKQILVLQCWRRTMQARSLNVTPFHPFTPRQSKVPRRVAWDEWWAQSPLRVKKYYLILLKEPQFAKWTQHQARLGNISFRVCDHSWTIQFTNKCFLKKLKIGKKIFWSSVKAGTLQVNLIISMLWYQSSPMTCNIHVKADFTMCNWVRAEDSEGCLESSLMNWS